MSDYKHIYNALDHAMRHLQQAQEGCDDTMHLDKEACGTWKKQIKEAEKALKGCYRKVESKHKKASAVQTKTASTTEDTLEVTLSASEQRTLRHQASSLNVPTSRLKRIANTNAEVAKANKEFLKIENRPDYILKKEQGHKTLFTLLVCTNDFKTALQADIGLLDDKVYLYKSEASDLLDTLIFRPMQAGELIESYFEEIISLVQDNYGGAGVCVPAKPEAEVSEDEVELEEPSLEDDVNDERDENTTTKTSSTTSRLKLALKKQAANYNNVKKTKQYKGFVIASAQDENGNDVFLIYTADEWMQGAGNRYEEWEAGNLEEAMDWINSN